MMNRLLPLAAENGAWAVARAATPYAVLGLMALLSGFGVLWLRREHRQLTGCVRGLWRWLMRSEAEVAAAAATDADDKPEARGARESLDPELVAVIAAAASTCLDEGEQIVEIHATDGVSEYSRYLWAWPAEGRRQIIASRERLLAEPPGTRGSRMGG